MQDGLEFFRVPKTDAQNISYLAGRYRELRLRGLELSPESFSSTYAIESLHPLDYWESQISSPGKELFICASSQSNYKSTDNSSSNQNDVWIAQLVIRGPIPEDQFRLSSEAGQLELSTEEAAQTSNWQLLGLYVNPNYRSQGISGQLIAHAIEWMRANSVLLADNQPVTQFRLRAMVKPENVPSQRLFQKLEFARAGTCTLGEAHTANGEVGNGSHPGGRRGGHIYILQQRLDKAVLKEE